MGNFKRWSTTRRNGIVNIIKLSFFIINDNDIDTYGVQSEIFKVTELILTRLLEQGFNK